MPPQRAARAPAAVDSARLPRTPRLRGMCPKGRAAFLIGFILVFDPLFPTLGKAVARGRPSSSTPSATASAGLVDVKVDAGRATWRWEDSAGERPTDSTRRLVMVSTLAREGGAFPIRLSLRTSPTTGGSRDEPETSPEPPDLSTSLSWWPIRGGERTVGDTTATPGFATPPRPARPPAPTRRFWMPDGSGRYADPSSYRAVETRLRGFDDRIQVYVDDADSNQVAPETLADLIETYCHLVEPMARGNLGLGSPCDLDGDGRFTVVLSSKLADFGGGAEPLEGFIRAADFDLTLPAPLSNHADLLWMSAHLRAGPRLRSILAHEYTHVLVLCRKVLDKRHAGGDGTEEESWLDEAMAHWVESRHGFSWENLDYRVSAFLSHPEAYRLVVPDYQAAGLFRGHGNRGATFLFFRWLADRFGEDLPGRIARCPETGTAAIERLVGRRFDDLFRAWGVDLFLNGLDPWDALETSAGALDLRDRIADWPLAGPRFHRLDPTARTHADRHQWESQPTSHMFFVVEPNALGATTLELEAAPDANIRVTILDLPAGWRPFDVIVEAAVTAERHAPKSERPGTLRVVVARTGGGEEPPSLLRSLSWEPLVPRADARAMPFRRGGFDWTASTRSAPPPAIRDRRPRVETIAAPALERDQSLIVKAVGLDHRGRRVVGWAEWRAEPQRMFESRSQPPQTTTGIRKEGWD